MDKSQTVQWKIPTHINPVCLYVMFGFFERVSRSLLLHSYVQPCIQEHYAASVRRLWLHAVIARKRHHLLNRQHIFVNDLLQI